MAYDPATMGFKMPRMDSVARTRATENRDCPHYTECFNDAAFAGRVATPCKSCTRVINEPPTDPPAEKESIVKLRFVKDLTRFEIMQGITELIEEGEAVTRKRLLERLRCYQDIQVIKARLCRMEKEGLVVIVPGSSATAAVTIELPGPSHSTPPHDAPLHDTPLHPAVEHPVTERLGGVRLEGKVAESLRQKIAAQEVPVPVPAAKASDPAGRNIALAIAKFVHVLNEERDILRARLQELSKCQENIEQINAVITQAEKLLREW